MESEIKLFGICGREGAGKSTASALMANGTSIIDVYYNICDTYDIIEYLIDIWFDFSNKNEKDDKDKVWGLTRIEIREKLTDIFDKFIGNWRRDNYRVPVNFRRICLDGWYVSGLADLLKLGCAGLFNYDLDILLGEDENSRLIRESLLTQEYTICGAMTGRRCLQYFATEVMRNNFDEGFWTKIIAQKIKNEISKGNRVIIPDVRFDNDLHGVWNLNGTIVMIYRHASDLLLSELDMKLHPSSWEFLKVLANNKDKNVIYVKNSSSIEKLSMKLKKL